MTFTHSSFTRSVSFQGDNVAVRVDRSQTEHAPPPQTATAEPELEHRKEDPHLLTVEPKRLPPPDKHRPVILDNDEDLSPPPISAYNLPPYVRPNPDLDGRVHGDYRFWSQQEVIDSDALHQTYCGLFSSKLDTGSCRALQLIEWVLRPDVRLGRLMRAVARAAEAYPLSCQEGLSSSQRLLTLPSIGGKASSKADDGREPWKYVDVQVGYVDDRMAAGGVLVWPVCTIAPVTSLTSLAFRDHIFLYPSRWLCRESSVSESCCLYSWRPPRRRPLLTTLQPTMLSLP